MLKTIPYSPEGYNTSFKRVIVLPIPKQKSSSAAGLIIPTDIGRICEIGQVVACDENSDLKVGDEVYYNKVDRHSPEHLDTITLEGRKHDVLYEQEVWSANGMPFGRIFVEPLSMSEVRVNNDGLLLPEGVTSKTEKGRVFRAPTHYSVKPGDYIEYRRQERDAYPTVDIDGKRYNVLFEADVYKVGEHASPHRIIVKIDMAMQRLKRNTTETGLIRTGLFQYMLHNLQLGEVLEIGSEASKIYPGLKVGDTAILTHTIEHQSYRLIKQEYGKASGEVLYEHRIINAFSADEREILGRIASRKDFIFVPFGKNIFLDWNFDLYEAPRIDKELLMLDFETNLDKCHDIQDFKATIDHKRKEGFDKSNAKMRGLTDLLSNTHHINQAERFRDLEAQLFEARKQALKIGGYLNHNHLLNCGVLGERKRVLVSYKELYPINILGKKFLVGHRDYIAAELVATI